MKRDSSRPSFFIGWDVGGWNCDRNRTSRDAIVILDDTASIMGKPWRGSLRKCIATSKETQDWVKGLFAKCEAQYPQMPPEITMAIDTPLGFSDEFVNLITRKTFVEADETSGLNRYLFRHTERQLFERGLRPLSALKDMIGSQATKGMHVLAKFASKTESSGVWTDGGSLRVIETYPAACRRAKPVKAYLGRRRSLGHDDKDDARTCAVIAYLFATKREVLEEPSAEVPPGEGWIWIPRTEV
jgi:predicted nuclease with RNAse H fold